MVWGDGWIDGCSNHPQRYRSILRPNNHTFNHPFTYLRYKPSSKLKTLEIRINWPSWAATSHPSTAAFWISDNGLSNKNFDNLQPTIFKANTNALSTFYWSTTSYLGKGKPSGLNAARKLRTHRRENRWADKQFKKRLLGTAFKSSPFGGSSHAKGIVLEKMYVEK
jgi:hypothetical protein